MSVNTTGTVTAALLHTVAIVTTWDKCTPAYVCTYMCIVSVYDIRSNFCGTVFLQILQGSRPLQKSILVNILNYTNTYKPGWHLQIKNAKYPCKRQFAKYSFLEIRVYTVSNAASITINYWCMTITLSSISLCVASLAYLANVLNCSFFY